MKIFSLLSVFAISLFSINAQAFPQLEVGDVAPCVVLEGIDSEGNETAGCIRDPEKETQTHTLIEFFSTICSDCIENLPNVAKLHKELGDRLQVRLVATDSKVEKVRKFITEKNIHEAVSFDPNKQAMLAYGVLSTPTIFILDSDNRIVFKHSGVLSPEKLSAIESIVGVNGLCTEEKPEEKAEVVVE